MTELLLALDWTSFLQSGDHDSALLWFSTVILNKSKMGLLEFMPESKGKVTVLKAGNFSGLYSALGELDANHAQLMEAKDRRSFVLCAISSRGLW